MVEDLPAVNLRVKPIDKALKIKSMPKLFDKGGKVSQAQPFQPYNP